MGFLKRMFLRPLRVMQAAYHHDTRGFMRIAGSLAFFTAFIAFFPVDNHSQGLSRPLLACGLLVGWYYWSVLVYQALAFESALIVFVCILLMASSLPVTGWLMAASGPNFAFGQLLGLCTVPLTMELEPERLGVP